MLRNAFLLIIFYVISLPVFSDELPVEAFASLPAITSPQVSPDGKHIAALIRNQQGYYDVGVTEFGGTEFTILARLKSALDRIEYIEWANNERLLVSASYAEEFAGNHFRVGRLFSVGLDGGDVVKLERASAKGDKDSRYYQGSGVISLLETDPEHILLQMYDPLDEARAVFKVNVYTGEFEKQFVNEYDVYRWFTNDAGEVVMGISSEDDGDIYAEQEDLIRKFWYRKDSDSEWKMVKQITLLNDDSFYPIASINAKDGSIYVLSDHELGRIGLYKYDIRKGEYQELVYAVNGYDLSGVLTEDGRLTGVTWYEDYKKQHYFNKSDADIYGLIKRTFKGASVSIASTDKNDKKIVVYATKDNVPGKYYLLDLEKGKASFWFSQHPPLEGVQLAEKQPFEYEASDGMKLNGYLTLPTAKSENAGKPPLIVMPHGGPHSRDYRYFERMVQWFANRGYAVLQMNFRGSSGFGSKYEALGYKEWGRDMQQDVVDAVKWAQASGKVNTGDMCLVGWSYGGYVALTASVQTPDLYDCIVSIAGISDLPALVKDDGWSRSATGAVSEIIGDVNNESEYKLLYANSAINYVQNVNTDMLLIHGTRDTRVRYGQSADFYEKAMRLDKNVEYMEIDNATHNLDYEPNRIDAFKRIDEFLEEHLK